MLARARYYNPYTGRFVSEDNYWGEETNPLSLNRYTYGHNNPIKYVDPSGHAVTDWDKQNLSSSEIKELEKLTRLWELADKAGNQDIKKQAHKEAEAIRNTKRAADEVGTGDGHTVKKSSGGSSYQQSSNTDEGEAQVMSSLVNTFLDNTQVKKVGEGQLSVMFETVASVYQVNFDLAKGGIDGLATVTHKTRVLSASSGKGGTNQSSANGISIVGVTNDAIESIRKSIVEFGKDFMDRFNKNIIEPFAETLYNAQPVFYDGETPYVLMSMEQAEMVAGMVTGYVIGSAFQGAVEGATNIIKGFNSVESKIINEAKTIINSSEFSQIKVAHETGQSVTVNIGGRIIQYEPGLPASGMTMFGENGFLIGNEAFTSSSELSKNILHELYRLNTSISSTGVSPQLAAQETKAAFEFAERAFKELMK